MKVSEQEIFDALTLYHKNDWKNGQYRGEGIQIGGSDWYLFRHHYSNLILYKTDKDYDISNFKRDFPVLGRYKDKVNVCFNFTLNEVNTVKKRKGFSNSLNLMGVA